MKKTLLLVSLIALVLLAGCGSFWEDQGTAAVRSARARELNAEAARQNAEATIIEARAQGILAESQADALTQSVSAVVDLADDGEYIALFAGISFGVLILAGLVVWAVTRRSAYNNHPVAPPRQIATIESLDNRIWQLEQGRGESYSDFLIRLHLMASRVAQEETQLLLMGPDKRT